MQATARRDQQGPRDDASQATFGRRWSSRATCAVLLAVTMLWSYWSTLVETIHIWNEQPDYSHGFLVLPIAIAFLWMRRASYPHEAVSGSLWGFGLIALALAIRIGSALLLIESLDGWTIPLWLAGVVVVFGGWKLLKWCGPAIAFLCFMFPLPYFAEQSLSRPLQSAATVISTSALQLLGYGAISEGNTIILGDQTLEVEQACSGLRIFVGIFALAFAYVLFVKRTWWEKAILLASAIPIALVANSTRIVVTGLLHVSVSGEAAAKFTHDLSGWVMIPFAAGLFWLVLWYFSRLLPEVEVLSASQLLSGELRTPNAGA